MSENKESASVSDYEEVLADHRRLVRELDVLLNGKDAARQASLCDIVSQVAAMKGKGRAINAYALADLIERLSVDAARYRWLRDVGDETWVPLGKRPGVQFTHQIDAAIDAALAKHASA